MQLLQLKQVPAAVAVMLASVIMIGFTFLIFTIWLHPDLGIGSLANWSDGTWQLAQLDTAGDCCASDQIQLRSPCSSGSLLLAR